jgi:hypothetical protein
MILYNVTIQIDPAIEADWLHWMHHEHLQEVVGTGCFDSYAFFRLLEPITGEEPGPTFIAQYKTDARERYERYIREFAPVLREKGFARFGDRFIAFRTVMEQLA